MYEFKFYKGNQLDNPGEVVFEGNADSSEELAFVINRAKAISSFMERIYTLDITHKPGNRWAYICHGDSQAHGHVEVAILHKATIQQGFMRVNVKPRFIRMGFRTATEAIKIAHQRTNRFTNRITFYLYLDGKVIFTIDM